MARLAVMPEDWFMNPDVGADEIAVLATLALHARDGSCFPSQGLLARLLNRSRPWVNKTITRLVELGLITRTHRQRDDGGERACLYRLAAPLEKVPSSGGDAAGSEKNTPSHAVDSIKTESEIYNRTPPARATDTKCFDQMPPVDIPETWQPTDQDLLWAIERFPAVDLAALTERFVLRCRAKGYRYRDLSAAWRSWLADDLRTPKPSRPDRLHPAETRFAAWATVATRANRGTAGAAA